MIHALAYALVGLGVAVVTVRLVDFDDPELPAITTMVLWPLVVLSALLWAMGWVIVELSELAVRK